VKRKSALAVCLVVIAGLAALPIAAQATRPAHRSAPQTTMMHKNIVQVAAASKQFSTLVALVKHAGLVKALEAKGPYTVFAPTNTAFAQLKRHHPKLYQQVASSKKLLAEVLEYHVVKGRYLAKQVVKHHTLKTLLGQKLKVKVKHGDVYINQARVVKANIMASNGVIHAINSVLIPKT
jgi:uncharacterized surface protein with fasciclin (FAS1) repeats